MTRRIHLDAGASVAVWIAVMAVTVVGCGGSSATGPTGADPQHSAFLAAVDLVCARAVARHAGHVLPVAPFDPEHPRPGELPAVADYFARYGGLPATTTALHALAPPREDVPRCESCSLSQTG